MGFYVRVFGETAGVWWGGEDVCALFCLHGIVAEMEHREGILQSRAVVGKTITLEVFLGRKK